MKLVCKSIELFTGETESWIQLLLQEENITAGMALTRTERPQETNKKSSLCRKMQFSTPCFHLQSSLAYLWQNLKKPNVVSRAPVPGLQSRLNTGVNDFMSQKSMKCLPEFMLARL